MTTADLKSVIVKLLDKAGQDPRLTPRLLREKAEQKLALQKGELKSKRDEIKDMVIQWYLDKKAKEEEATTSVMRALAKIGKVSGLAPAVFKGVKEMDTDEERIITLRKRLREKGLVFSDVPTAEEIEKIRLDHEKKKDLEGIDTTQILDGPRKRPSKDMNSPTESSNKKAATEESKLPVKKYNNHTYASDEEAEAEL